MEVSVSLGDSVSIGDTLLLLESMKMEIPVLSEFEGQVIDVGVAAGDVIQEGDPLIAIETSGKSERRK